MRTHIILDTGDVQVIVKNTISLYLEGHIWVIFSVDTFLSGPYSSKVEHKGVSVQWNYEINC